MFSAFSAITAFATVTTFTALTTFTTAATAAAMRTLTTWRARCAFLARTCFTYHHAASADFLSVQGRDSGTSFVVVVHLYETEPFGTAGVTIRNNSS